MSENNDNGAMKGTFFGFVLGFAAGTITAMLLTTKTGEELRSDLRKATSEIRENVAEKAADVKELTKKKYEDIVNNAISNYKKAKQLTEKEVDFIKKTLMEQKDIIK
ncbi:MAG: YtxH domain-containing protein [Candidatus Humimicrobiaceae bacterium]